MLIRSLTLAALLALVAPVLPARADDGATALRQPSARSVASYHGGRVVRVDGHGHGHVHRHGCCRYVPARTEIRRQRVVVPGHYVERVLPAEFEVRWDGRHCVYVRVEVRPRRVVRTWVPARVEIRRKRVRVPASWICS